MMRGLLDDLLVGAVLAASVAYALYALGPKTLRRRVLLGLASLLARLPAIVGVRAITGRLASAAVAGKGACGGCDNCGATQPPAAQPAAEVRIPFSAIGKRG